MIFSCTQPYSDNTEIMFTITWNLLLLWKINLFRPIFPLTSAQKIFPLQKYYRTLVLNSVWIGTNCELFLGGNTTTTKKQPTNPPKKNKKLNPGIVLWLNMALKFTLLINLIYHSKENFKDFIFTKSVRKSLS